MVEPLYRLLAWLSPAYPIGAFSYSHGIETAVEEGFIKDRVALGDLAAQRAAAGHRRGRRRAVRRRLAGRRRRRLVRLRRHRRARGGVARHVGDGARIAPAGRLVPVHDAQGRGRIPRSMRRTSAWRASCRCRSPWRWPPPPTASPWSRPLEGYLHAFTANLISAALRTVPLGQSDGQVTLAALEETVLAAAHAAIIAASLDEVGTATPLLDWCSLRHETQYTRLFRS